MACETLRIVKACIVAHLFMWIVTSNSGETSVRLAPAAAMRETIGLKADIDRQECFDCCHIQRRPMTSTAKIIPFNRAERGRCKYLAEAFVNLVALHCPYMFCAGSMAGLAAYSGHSMIRIKLSPQRRLLRVAGKERSSIYRGERMAECFFECFPGSVNLSRRLIEPFDLVKIRAMPFVKRAAGI